MSIFTRFLRVFCVVCIASTMVSFATFADITIMEWTANVTGGTVSGVARCGPKSGSTGTSLKNWVASNWNLQNGGCFCRAQDVGSVTWTGLSETFSTAEDAGATNYWYGSGTNYTGGFSDCTAGCAATCASAFENDSSYQTSICGGTCDVVLDDPTEYSITYNNNGGAGCANTTYTGRTTLCVPTRTDYTFNGWATINGGSVVYSGGETVSGTNLTLYAVWTEYVCTDCVCGDSSVPSPTSAVSGLPTWDDMVSDGTITGSGTNYKPATDKTDDYIAGQEWSVTFNNGVVSGYSACLASSWSSGSLHTSMTSANSGCNCSLDKTNWRMVGDLNGGYSNRATKTEYCRANCPAECAARFAADTNSLRTNMISDYGECPVVASQPTSVQCVAGTYLPANTSVCVSCLADNYCAGGTFNTSGSNQGLTACPNSLYAPAGMSSVNQCGRILRIEDDAVYLRSVAQTIPSLNVDVDNDGSPDFFGNMTQTNVPMTNGSSRRLEVEYNNQQWYIYDDSVDVNAQ